MERKDQKDLLVASLTKAMSYSEYRKLVDLLFTEGKTTGQDHSESMLTYTELNIARKNKWDKHFKLSDDDLKQLTELTQNEIWLVITEAWCGDAAHALPVMAKIAEASASIELKIVLRDENSELMDQYLTNGGRSIPKLIRLNAEDHSVLSTWGPRPQLLQDIFLEGKENGEDMKELKRQMQIWFARNRGKAILGELMGQLELSTI